MTLRIVRFPITADTYECMITDLPRDTFPANELKTLYYAGHTGLIRT